MNGGHVSVNSAPTCQENIPSGAALAYLSSSQDAPTPLDQKERNTSAQSENSKKTTNHVLNHNIWSLTFLQAGGDRNDDMWAGSLVLSYWALQQKKYSCKSNIFSSSGDNTRPFFFFTHVGKYTVCINWDFQPNKKHTWCLLMMSFSFPSSLGSMSGLR